MQSCGSQFERAASILLIAVAAAVGGCDKVSELADQAAQQVQTAPNTAEPVKRRGRVQLQLDPPVETTGCYATLSRVSGRPAVLQVASYTDSRAESFPSFFLRAQSEQAEPAAMIGTAIDAEVYLQRQADGPIWYATAEQPAQIVVRSATADDFKADLQGVFVNSETGASQNVTGKLNGTLK